MIVVRGCEFPESMHYHVQHNVWLEMLEPGIVTLGATSFGVALAVEFVSFRAKPVGTVIDADGSVGLIELWKTLVSVRTPVAGTIAAANEAVAADPSLINRDPYGEGWLVRLRVPKWDAANLVTGYEIARAFDAAMSLENFEEPARSP